MSDKHLRNPEKWIGKYVRHLKNWRSYQYGETYAVCEWTGKLIRVEDDYGWSKEEIEIVGKFYDPAYYYSSVGAAAMIKYALSHPERVRKVQWIGLMI